MPQSILPAKVRWKIAYRFLRIARREGLFAFADTVRYGIGSVLLKPTGEVKYVNPLRSIDSMTQSLINDPK